MPGENCAVFGCGSCRRTKGIGIWKLPLAKDEAHEKWREEWLGEIKKTREMDRNFRELIKYDRVYTCEKHFAPEDIEILAPILESTLVALKASYSRLREAFLRSNLAGCYHNAYLILSLATLGERVGIRILRYDLNNPQAGKDVCERRIATRKSHMRRFINEGNDLNTANYMRVAIESYCGVKGFHATAAEIQDSFQSMMKHSMTGIRALNNFLFDSAGLRAWKAYNVGTGRFFSLAQLQKYCTPQGPTDEAESAKRLVASYSYPEQGCVKVYKESKGLKKHLDVGRHLIKLERESDYDSIIAKWAEKKTFTGDYVQGEVGGAPSVTESPSVSADNPSLEEGWAMEKSKSRLSALNKSGVLKRNVNVSQEEEEDFDYISEVEAMETRFQIRRELEL
ncbi:hypothetical protein AWC38_SpisGene21824 [Stylophora pistillata]|uniref:THAP-type domain-containing protein n=1 Tax=Stylophora pistillata TaxID=50429 RepID=A0A2B4RC12_STYPI|nr:hypothetical protein AWC38_SpisGene21824 [Stylophora pistillata]